MSLLRLAWPLIPFLTWFSPLMALIFLTQLITEEFSLSEHNIINFDGLIKPLTISIKIQRRNLRKVDWTRFQILISDIPDWPKILASNDIDIVWNHLRWFLKKSLDQIAPLRSIPTRNFMLSSKVRTALRQKRRCFMVYKNLSNLKNLVAYKRSAVIADYCLKKDLMERENYMYIACSSDPRMFWSRSVRMGVLLSEIARSTVVPLCYL